VRGRHGGIRKVGGDRERLRGLLKMTGGGR
jgi:hypothetical protein